MRPVLSYTIVTALLVTAGASWSGCSSGREGPSPGDNDASQDDASFRNVQQRTAFVGDDVCFDCHESEYTGYKDHGMARSYYRLTEQNSVEEISDVHVVDTSSGLRYTVVRKSDGLYQEEYATDSAGNKVHSLLRRMDYVVGSGTAARTYVSENDGRLYQLPLTWYTQERRWDFSPGYDVANFRFGRTVPDRCMACHNSYPETVPFVEGKYLEVPNGIGCERCHGPGELHVRERLEFPEPLDEIDDSIVNPAHLTFDRRMDVCQQCHLHTTVSLVREARGPFDFRPSESLADHIALFAEEDAAIEAGIDVISHADRMKQSECFLATVGSDRPLECTTCHDPHQGFRSLGRDYFNDTCISCHATPVLADRFVETPYADDHVVSSDCFGCHMPRVEAEDAPHSSFTDHRIRVVRSQETPKPVAAHDDVTLRPYFAVDQGTDSGATYRAMAQVVYGRQVSDLEVIREGVERLDERVRVDSSNSEATFLLGLGLQLLGEHGRSIGPLETAVRAAPDNPERLNALGQAYELASVNTAVAGRLYRRALSVQPQAADIRVNYGRFLQAQGLVDQAITEYSLAIDENEWLDVAHFNLGTALAGSGRLAEAERAFNKTIQLNPLHAEALGNLGSVLAAQGREGAAELAFERAVQVAPRDATALGNLGAFRLNGGQEDEAIDLLRRAIVLRPDFVDAIANLALAYFRTDDYETARRFARRALEIDPPNQLARQIIAATE